MSASPYDAPLSAIRSHVENTAVWLAIWEARREPDAHARRCASDAVDAIDAMLHAIRQLLISEVQQADRATATRVDALLARTDDAMTSSNDRASPEPTGPGDDKAGRSNARPQQEGKKLMTGNDITKTTGEQVQALTKAGYDLYCAAENLAGQAIAAWPYPDLAEELREQLAGRLEELARQMRGDYDEDEGDAEAQIAAYMADRKFRAGRDARLESDESGGAS
jgi:hypothetical protein